MTSCGSGTNVFSHYSTSFEVNLFENRLCNSSSDGGCFSCCSNIFQLFDTAEREDHFVASRKRWLESHLKFQGEMAKAPPCPERTLITPMPQQSSPSSRDEESQWITVEDGRR